MRMRRGWTWAATAFLCAWLAPVVAGAEDGTWIDFGVGAGRFSGLSGGVTGLAGHIAGGWVGGKTVVSARAVAVGDISSCILCQSEGDRVDLGLLLGRQWVGESALFSVGAGIGYLKGQHLPSSTVGLALEARLIGRLSRRVGLGVYGFGNVNSQDSFWGATLALRFGGF